MSPGCAEIQLPADPVLILDVPGYGRDAECPELSHVQPFEFFHTGKPAYATGPSALATDNVLLTVTGNYSAKRIAV